MIEVNFNLNQKVRVKITEAGEVHLRNIHRNLYSSAYKKGFEPDYISPKRDSHGWSEFQLWEIMGLFGSSMIYPNFNCLIEPEIVLLKPD